MATRHYSLRIPHPFRPAGRNDMVFHDEIISGELGQVGTQFDGLGHIGIGEFFYNGNRRSDFAQPEGLTRLGVENVGVLATRGSEFWVVFHLPVVSPAWCGVVVGAAGDFRTVNAI